MEVADVQARAVGFGATEGFVESCPSHAGFVAVLFRRHRKVLLWYLKNLVPSLEDAEDVAQEAYLRLLRVADLDEDDARARNYLFKTATNLAFDCHRRRVSRSEHLHVAVESLEVADDAPALERIVDQQQGLSVVSLALRDLLPRARAAFLLHWHTQMTYRQIAVRLGVSKKTVERDIALTLKLCRSRLEEKHID